MEVRTSLRHSNCVVFDSANFNLALAVRGLDGEKLATLTGLSRATIGDARSGKPVHATTARKITLAMQAVEPMPLALELLRLREKTVTPSADLAPYQGIPKAG